MLGHNPYASCTIGERYHADVPDTLDLAERMRLSVNALTRAWFPEERWALAFNVDFSRRPPALRLGHRTDCYLNLTPKFLEALALCRPGSGSKQNLDVDENVLRVQLELLGDDGLTYCPSDTLRKYKDDSGFAEVWGEGRSLLALSMLEQVDDDPRWTDIGRRKVDRLLELTREKEGFRFLWRGRFKPGQTTPNDADEPDRPIPDGSLGDKADPVLSMIYSVGAAGHGSGLFHRVTGYEPARELSRGLARWALARMFKNEDGRYWFYHFHHGLYALMAVCHYGLLADDREVLQRVDACYRWAREMGEPLIGFFSEAMPGHKPYLERRGNTVEICEVADMVVLALWLTRAGIGDYWDDIDRWMRNMYAEGQMVDDGPVDQIPEDLLVSGPMPDRYETTEDVAARSVGSFWGWMHANDAFKTIETGEGAKLQNRSIMHCCTANGSRTLYYVWDAMVSRETEEVRVNLLLNRASPWLDVDSYLPVEGKVVLRIKDAPRVAVRMPEWSDPSEVRAVVGGEPRQTRVEARWVRLGGLQRGDEVTLTFPVPERTVHRVIGEIPFKLTLRGSNVVDIDPKGARWPLFENQPSGRLIKRSRFIPQTQSVTW